MNYIEYIIFVIVTQRVLHALYLYTTYLKKYVHRLLYVYFLCASCYTHYHLNVLVIQFQLSFLGLGTFENCDYTRIIVMRAVTRVYIIYRILNRKITAKY